MPISWANVDYMWHTVVDPRIGDDYGWGAALDPNDVTQGTDCSGFVGYVIKAMLYGPKMTWDRAFWTGTFAGLNPGDVGAFGLVCVEKNKWPADAACIVAIKQNPDPSNAHMVCQVQGVDIESGGNGMVTGPRATSILHPQFNQWFYLPGPILPKPGGVVPTPVVDSLISALRSKGLGDQQIRLIKAFSKVEGNNPAGNPTLGFTDAQLGGASDLQSHVDALVKQFSDRASVAGLFPQNGSDQDQAEWIARVVGQAGSDSDWQGNAQPKDYVQRVIAAMQSIPVEPQPIPVPEPGDFMSALSPEEQRALYDEIMGGRKSRSPLHVPGEGIIGDLGRLEENTDGSVHILVQYLLGVILRSPQTLAELDIVARNTDPEQQGGRRIAQAMLKLIKMIDAEKGADKTDPQPTPTPNPTPPPPANPPPIVAPPDPSPNPPYVTPANGVQSNISNLNTEISSLRTVLSDLSRWIRS